MGNLHKLFMDFLVFYFDFLNCIFQLNGTVNTNLSYGDNSKSSGFLYFKWGQLNKENWLELPNIVNELHYSLAKNVKKKQTQHIL